jgi:hypothetical protein
MSYKHLKSSLCKNQPEQNEEHEIKEFHWSDKKSKSLEAAVAAGCNPMDCGNKKSLSLDKQIQ